ncbi:tRNA (adenosine(37)-N6)-threonylcarbamoyltransferase complex ATPase subunit type 1 TsaE [Nonlabens xiamenensis]|uniref:tRNA (adenosine(37)-N6)-threonylcarbamoyltransferase complex ATPase subunit type 1 TsaE n=1 Tax=Nonlabens xiamenensis TaxID=2341043 RepID=UPI000F60754F|nr:tRNA (adenosine(37)-N6)-threonylcarbamoyltransferase complex ATPase subunit type 1 TsaE [Nonlabens xiamenensis]
MQLKYSILEIDLAATWLLEHSNHKVMLFDAPMGSGKTTLISSICKRLGVEDEISSPTFSIVNEYRANNNAIFHYDLYRIEDSNQLFDIGINDYLDNDAFHLVEWPELIKPYLTQYHIINISVIDNHTRLLDIKTL